VATLIAKVLFKFVLLHNGLNIAGNEASPLDDKYVNGNCFDVVCMGSPAIIRLCRYIVYFNHFNNHIVVATQKAGGCSPFVKD